MVKTLACVCVLFMLCTPSAKAQAAQSDQAVSDSDIQLLRSDIQADKNTIISATMQFNDKESAAFAPVYRDYARDQQIVGDDRVKLIKDYADHYESMDDATAKNLAHRLFDIDSRLNKLREQYWPRFETALGAKRAAKFFQVDSRLTLMINLKLTSAIPLIQ